MTKPMLQRLAVLPKLLWVGLVVAGCGKPHSAIPEANREPPLVERHTFTLFITPANYSQAVDTVRLLVDGGAKDIYVRMVFLGDGWRNKAMSFASWQQLLEQQTGIRKERIKMTDTGYPMGEVLNEPMFGTVKEVQMAVDSYLINTRACRPKAGEAIRFGCAQKINRALMVKDPSQLLAGEPKEPSLAEPAARVVEKLKRGETADSPVTEQIELPSTIQ